jgi:hypothetical protein
MWRGHGVWSSCGVDMGCGVAVTRRGVEWGDMGCRVAVTQGFRVAVT